jgi:hypothetical protein
MILLDLSLDAANRFYAWGWRMSLIGAAITGVGLLFMTWGNRVRDQDFEEQVAVLHTRAATSEERAAGLEKEAAQLRLDLAGIKLAPVRQTASEDHSATVARHVTPEQRSCILGRLKQFKSPVAMRFEPDQEAAEYAASLREVFAKAGVPVSFSGAPRTGLSGVRLTEPGGEVPAGAAEITSILQYCGVPLDQPMPGQQARAIPNTKPEEVLIFIGSKPPAK